MTTRDFGYYTSRNPQTATSEDANSLLLVSARVKEHIRQSTLLRVDGLRMTTLSEQNMVDCGVGNLYIRSEENAAAFREGSRSDLEVADGNTRLTFDLSV